MNPADSTQFLTQTAQFTQVETLQKMEKEQAAAQSASQVLAASTMIGRPVTYSLARERRRRRPRRRRRVVSVRGSLPKDAAVGATAARDHRRVHTRRARRSRSSSTSRKTATVGTCRRRATASKLGQPVAITFDATGDRTTNDLTIPAAALDGIDRHRGRLAARPASRSRSAPRPIPTRLQLASGPATVVVAEQNGNDGQTATGIVTGVHMTADGPQLVIGGQQIPYTSITDVQS